MCWKSLVFSTLLCIYNVHLVHSAYPPNVERLMNTSVDPCKDFYQYACGTWLNETKLPDDISRYSYPFTTIALKNEGIIQDILSTSSNTVLQSYWSSCVDTTTIEARGNAPLQSFFTQLQAMKTKVDVFQYIGQLRASGFNFVYSVNVSPDESNGRYNVLSVGISPLTVTENMALYLDNYISYIATPFRTYITQLLQSSGYGKYLTSTSLRGTATPIETTIIRIQQQLASYYFKATDFGNNILTVGTALSTFPTVFQSMWTGMNIPSSSTSTSKDSRIIFQSLQYATQVEKYFLLSPEEGGLTLDELKTYVAFLYIDSRVYDLSKRYQDYSETFHGTIRSLLGLAKPSSPTRSRLCVTQAVNNLPHVVGAVYAAKALSKKGETDVRDMVYTIEKAMAVRLRSTSWLDEATLKVALEKLSQVANLIGYSNSTLSIADESFTDLSKSTYFENMANIRSVSFRNALKTLDAAIDRNAWQVSTASAKAEYSYTLNQMMFSAGILQSPLFDTTVSLAQNYGALGSIIGHELTHAFDNNGRYYDGNGRLTNWWTTSAEASFNTHAKCMQDQYQNLPAVGEDGVTIIGNVDGALTLAENIADNGGLSLAFDAFSNIYTSPVQNTLDEQKANELFFIAYAQSRCGKDRNAAIRTDLQRDPHAPYRWRTNIVLANSKTFATVFQCRTNTPMNPITKCTIW